MLKKQDSEYLHSPPSSPGPTAESEGSTGSSPYIGARARYPGPTPPGSKMKQLSLRAVALLFFATFLPLGAQVAAQGEPQTLTLSALVSDGMVLQRNSVASVWGTGRPGAQVLVTPSWSTGPTRAFVEGNGSWRLKLETPTAGGPHTIEFGMDAQAIQVTDVLIGEVWLASGQSNMEWKIAGVASGLADFEEQRANINQPRLRYFDVPNRISMTAETSLGGNWQSINPSTWPGMSAVAYYFADDLQQRLHVPIGIISAEWGGTVAESWTSEASLRAGFPEFDASLNRIQAASTGDSDEESMQTLQEKWWSNLAAVDEGSRENWNAKATDTSAWRTMELPGTWEDQGLSFDGVVWFRREVVIPREWAGQELMLELGAIDDMDTTWWDGERVGGLEIDGQWQTPRRYTVPASRTSAGSHTIAIRVVDTAGAGGMTGLNGELGLGLKNDSGADKIALDGSWSYSTGAKVEELGSWPRRTWFGPNHPTALFNGMISPLRGYGLAGVIWYQGESNLMRSSQYERLFPAMIRDWRGFFGQAELPFLFVQIAPYRYGSSGGDAALLRDAQRKTLEVPRTGMASTMDIGNPGNIHPLNKWDVGQRLALWARAFCYGETELDVSGPLYRSVSIEGSRLRIEFDYAEEGLVAKGGALTHFQIAGADHVFHPAEASIDGSSLLVSSPQVAAPVAARFAWGDADQPNFFDAGGLPASSFRTDDWSDN
ncbi:MAG: sialate O-acetylesterase [Planctomycetota bacterium]|jgi:sialate O-acetylesterase